MFHTVQLSWVRKLIKHARALQTLVPGEDLRTKCRSIARSPRLKRPNDGWPRLTLPVVLQLSSMYINNLLVIFAASSTGWYSLYASELHNSSPPNTNRCITQWMFHPVSFLFIWYRLGKSSPLHTKKKYRIAAMHICSSCILFVSVNDLQIYSKF